MPCGNLLDIHRLSNLMVELLRLSDIIVAWHTCEADSTFDSIMRGLMRDLPPRCWQPR